MRPWTTWEREQAARKPWRRALRVVLWGVAWVAGTVALTWILWGCAPTVGGAR